MAKQDRIPGTSATAMTPSMLAALEVKGRQFKDARSRLNPGEHPVDFKVRIHGTINVGADQPTTKKTKPEAKTLLAIVKESVTKAAWTKVKAAIAARYQEARNAETGPTANDDALAEADDLIAAVTTQADDTRRGSVAGAIAVDILD